MMIRPALIFLFSSFLAACGGGGSGIGEGDGTEDRPQGQIARQVGFEFINTSEDAVDFYIKESQNATPLFDESNQVVVNSDKQVNQYIHTWTTPTPLTVDIGAIDTNSQSPIGAIDDLVTNSGENYWLIAWPDSELGENVLFAGRQEPISNDDKYTVRIFSLKDIKFLHLANGGAATSSGFLKKGEISTPKILDNCSGNLFINDALVVNLCGNDSGRSYLLITDGVEVLSITEEK